MNRTAVVFLALAILLAHTLAIHQTADGGFASAYDMAHVAYRLGRNLVHEGRPLWDPLGPWIESHPSPLLVGVAAAAERLYLFPTVVSQALGVLCALGTIVVVAQFSPKRMAGLIAPMLLATSGGVAAAAASGTEAPLAMALLALAFLAFERRWGRTLLLALLLLALARPEGAAVAAAFALLEVLDRPASLDRGSDAAGRRAALRPAFWSLAALLLAIAVLRHSLTGTWFSPLTGELLAMDAQRWELGAHYLWSFVIGSGAGMLLVLPVVCTLGRRIEPTGRRALVLALLWAAWVGLAGGDRLPFWNALVPALPLAFLSVQSSITCWIDRRPRHAPLAWGLLGLAVGASLLASKLATDVGPLPLNRILSAWRRPTATLADAYERELARGGLVQAIEEVERLRNVALFLRDNTEADASIATLWPGAIGYLTRKEVHDLLGRADLAPDSERTHSWRGVPRVDLVRALERRVDYLVTLTAGPGGSIAEFLRGWLRRYDVIGDDDARLRELLHALRQYELVSVPVPKQSATPRVRSPHPFLILRNKDLELSPRLELRREGDTFTALVSHHGHQQLVDLWVAVTDSAGNTWNMRPTGEWTRDVVDARTHVLVYDTGPRPIHMLRARLPAELEPMELLARLHTPGMRADAELAAVGPQVTLALR